MSEEIPDPNPKTFSGWVVCLAGGWATVVVAGPVALAAQGVAVLRGRDGDKAFEAVLNPAAKALNKGIEVADKYNETIVKAGINAAIDAIADRSSTTDRHRFTN
ncbi:hypothetical protein [Streptomyces sp. NPDC057494]|uniref:hypothetical protein n=1 Tax=Streptomyces sp. NPDC057494 TaxID=3346148 RepID=UPI0036B5DB41